MPVRKFGVAATVMGDPAALYSNFVLQSLQLCQQARSLNVFYRW